MSLENTDGENSISIVIYNLNVSPRLSNMELHLSGGDSRKIGIVNENASPNISALSITIDSDTVGEHYGIFSFVNSSIETHLTHVSDSKINSQNGIGIGTDGTAFLSVRNSKIEARTGYSVNSALSNRTFIRDSIIVELNTGPAKCSFVMTFASILLDEFCRPPS